MKFQSFKTPKTVSLYYKPNLYETFLETSLKPIETFYTHFETFESSEVSNKFQSFNGYKLFIPMNLDVFSTKSPVSVETGEVSSENGICSVLAPFLGGFTNNETFFRWGGQKQDFTKMALNLFKRNPLKVHSLSKLIKQ